MARKISRALLSACVLLAMALFLLRPARYGESVLNGVSLWAVSVLPATFPFLFLTSLFTSSPLFSRIAKGVCSPAKKLFRVSGSGACVALLAAVSGYPVGARGVLDLCEREGRGESFLLACLATTSGPMFLVGAVGSGMWGRPLLGWVMLLCHFFAVWSVCFVLARFHRPAESAPVPMREKRDLYDVLYSSVISILYVGGSIALFCAFGQMIADMLPSFLPETLTWVLRGLVEMTTGCALFAAKKSAFSLALSCFFVTFGGVCVLCQQLGFLMRAGVKPLPFLAVKFLQGLLAGALCYAIALPLF